MTALNFDATTVDPTSPIAALPAGTYRAHITASEVKPTKNQTGKYLQLEFTVLDGDFKGRKFWERLNIQNTNQTAQEIAQRTLSAICHATGVLKLTNSQQLHHIPVTVKLTVKQDAGYEPRNEVKGYEKAEGGAPATAATTSAPPASAAAPAWAKQRAS